MTRTSARTKVTSIEPATGAELATFPVSAAADLELALRGMDATPPRGSRSSCEGFLSGGGRI